MSGADRLSDLREDIDHLDWMLRRLIRERIKLGRAAVQRRGGGTDSSREQEILNACESDTERHIFKTLFAASKGEAGVQRPIDDGD